MIQPERSGEVSVSVTVRDASGKTLAELERAYPVIDEAEIAAENAHLREQLQRLNMQLRSLRQQSDVLAEMRRLEDRRNELYQRLEQAWAERRQRRLDAPDADQYKSIDEPYRPDPAGQRARICINGDQWLVARYPDRPDGNYAPPPDDAFVQFTVPAPFSLSYFMELDFPVRRLEAEENVLLAGWQHQADHPAIKTLDMRSEPRTWFRYVFEVPAGQEAQQWRFICERINGYAEVYVNKRYCGNYRGGIGIVDIPLCSVRPGRNVLEVYVEGPGVYPESQAWSKLGPYAKWGLAGDVYLERASHVRVDDVWVRTSFRNSTLRAETTMVNATPEAVTAKVRQYCVLNDRIKYVLGEASVR